MSVPWLSVIWVRTVSCVAASKVLSQRELCQIEVEGNELVCSHDGSLMVLGKSLPLATKLHRACQKM